MILPFRLLARLPLSWLHGAGAAVGWIVYLASPVYASRMRKNLAASRIFADRAALYTAQRVPLTSLYRPPRQPWLEPLMVKGRSRGNARVSPATLRGVRTLYKALKN